MIYLVSNQQQLFETDEYQQISIEKAIEMLQPHDLIEFDSETQGLDPYTKKLLCTQYGIGDDQIVIDHTTISIENLRCILEDPNKVFLGWNTAFDLKFLYHHKIVPYNVWDGMIAEKLLYLGYPAFEHSLSLQSAASLYLKVNIDKTVRGEIITQGLTIPVIKYAAGDVTYLRQIKVKQDIELKKKGLLKAAEFEMKFVPVIAYMSYCGAKLDKNKWNSKIIRDKELVIQTEQALNKWVEDYYKEHKSGDFTISVNTKEVPFKEENTLFDTLPLGVTGIKRKINGDNVYYSYNQPFNYVSVDTQGDLFTGFNTEPKCNLNWASSKQVVPLFELLGLNCTVLDKKTKVKKKSADIKLIEPQKEKCSIVDIYVEYKKAKILVDTFGEKFIKAINPVSGRIHPNYFQLGADTGRLSASEPSLMNLPKDPLTRACFIPEVGNKWISCDYKG